MSLDDFDNIEDAFRRLEAKAYWKLASQLAAYREALMQRGFTRRESLRIVESFADNAHELLIEDAYIGKKFSEIADDLANLDDDEETTTG